jgi:NADPH2:quinone reductase
MKVVQVREPGGPETMQVSDAPVPVPGPGQALVRIAASGVNFIDVYLRLAAKPPAPSSRSART